MRYWFQVVFNNQSGNWMRVYDIHEEFKTLREAESYKSIVDRTVLKARIVDSVTEKIIWEWHG